MGRLTASMSMFTIIPMPKSGWPEEGGAGLLSFFPFAGLVIGACSLGACRLLGFAGIPRPIYAALLMAVPFILSGFMHLDGFMDVSDAILSHRDRETKLKILKDPHTGSFGVIMLVLLLIFTYAAVYCGENGFALCFAPAVSRAAAGLSLEYGPVLESSSLGRYFTANTQKRHFVILYIWLICGLTALTVFAGAASAVCAVLGGLISALAVRKLLGGVSGDTAGFVVCICECSALVGACL